MAENDNGYIRHQEESNSVNNDQSSECQIILSDSYMKFVVELLWGGNADQNNANSEEGSPRPNRIGWLPHVLLRDDQNLLCTYCYPRELPIGPICHVDTFNGLPQMERHRLNDLVIRTKDLKTRLARKFVKNYFPREGLILNEDVKEED